MQITNYNWGIKSFPNSTSGAEAVADQSSIKQSSSALSDPMTFESLNRARSLWAASQDITIYGKEVAPQDRMRLDGVTAEYLQNMTDEEYAEALKIEGNKYSHAHLALMDKLFAQNGDNSSRSTQPSFSPAEAKDTLQTYISNLTGTISIRNRLFTVFTSENMKQVLTERFGEEGANKQMENNMKIIARLDGMIENTVTSLNVLFSFSGTRPLATKMDDLWTFNPSSAQHGGNGTPSSFVLDHEGNVQPA